MAKEQKILLTALIMASVLLFVLSIICCYIRSVRNKRAPEKYNKTWLSTNLVLSGTLIISIWLLRFAVGYYAIVVSVPRSMPLSSWEEFINSFFGAIRTFGVEEEYSTYIQSIKAMVSAFIPDGNYGHAFCRVALVAYATILNVLAPFIGGAIILEVLANVFPKVRLVLSYLNIRRPKIYFSEFTAESLVLAKSISEVKKSEKPVLIFTDTFVDKENEKEYELLLEAKRYGAICVRDDLAHVPKPLFGKRQYYLMDINEFGNLQMLLSLSEDNNSRYVVNSDIYLFVQSDAYIQIEKQVREKFKKFLSSYTENNSQNKKCKGIILRRIMRTAQLPTVIPVNSFQNMINNLLCDVPLYEPLIHRTDASKLNVTILGNGIIGTEAFLSSYWLGQMLISGVTDGKKTINECQLNINVVSKDTEDVFWSKIDYINPEIKSTIEVVTGKTSQPPGDILCYNSEGAKSTSYCKVRYLQADLKIGSFWNSESEEIKTLLDSDYFIVALGSDTDNISVAEKLRLAIGKKHMENSDCSDNNTVIAYAVFNSELCRTLNEKRFFQCREKGKTDIYMYAFGSLEQVYSCDNVYMSKYLLWAMAVGEAYNSVAHKNEDKHIKENRSRLDKDEDSNYKYWSDLARAMHIKYKVFSLGWINTSVFDYNLNDFGEYERTVNDSVELYQKLCQSAEVTDVEKDEDIRYKQHCLAWLEHRRWCAFARTRGYQHSGKIERHLDLNGINYKNMDLKLHPCLVEAEKPNPPESNTFKQRCLYAVFVRFNKELDIKDGDDEQIVKKKRVAFLNEKIGFYKGKLALLNGIKREGLDALDMLSLDWCSLVLPKNIANMEEERNKVSSSAPGDTDIDSAQLFSYGDFKEYDYYTHEFEEG